MNDDIIKNLEFLVPKSRDLLQEQLKSFENCNNKAGVLISISSLFVPIAILFINYNELNSIIKIIALFSVSLSIVAIFFLLRVTTPKGLDHGFNFSQFQSKTNGAYLDLLIYEISANKSSYEGNETIVFKQIQNIKHALKSIFMSVIFLLIAGIGSFFTQNNYSEKYKQIEIENLNIKKMEDNNQETDNSNQSSQSTRQIDTNQQGPVNFDSVPSTERANIQKGDDSSILKTKEKK